MQPNAIQLNADKSQPRFPFQIQCNAIQCNTIHYITIQCNKYNTIQYTTMQYNIIQNNKASFSRDAKRKCRQISIPFFFYQIQYNTIQCSIGIYKTPFSMDAKRKIQYYTKKHKTKI